MKRLGAVLNKQLGADVARFSTKYGMLDLIKEADDVHITMKEFPSTKQIAVEVLFEELHTPNSPLPEKHARGIYCMLGDDRVGLFAVEGSLYLFLNGLDTEVWGKQVRASLHLDGENQRLSIMNGQSQKDIVYKNSEQPVSTQFYSEDDEDVDFGRWLSNVLSSEERQKIFVQTWF